MRRYWRRVRRRGESRGLPASITYSSGEMIVTMLPLISRDSQRLNWLHSDTTTLRMRRMRVLP
ncbi:hypothetical protein DPMN_055648 [Dreissena polymorpha]|uniref:Uncharacterized protein n=1 Tax=Dreissena polymorpha TaxID=45954 RepID=A0A9D4HSW2_DREPO|nr:hypothetical protein DPMN_055648 [Dreissena polymorpha]